MKKEEVLRIDELSNKIRDNTANLNDYEEYESLLNKAGYSHEFIMSKLKEANVDSYKDLIEKRFKIASDLKQRKKDALERRKIIEGIAVVGLVAIGLAIFFAFFRNKKAKALTKV